MISLSLGASPHNPRMIHLSAPSQLRGDAPSKTRRTFSRGAAGLFALSDAFGTVGIRLGSHSLRAPRRRRRSLPRLHGRSAAGIQNRLHRQNPPPTYRPCRLPKADGTRRGASYAAQRVPTHFSPSLTRCTSLPERGTCGHTVRPAPSVRRACPSRRCVRFPACKCGRRGGWWKDGGK